MPLDALLLRFSSFSLNMHPETPSPPFVKLVSGPNFKSFLPINLINSISLLNDSCSVIFSYNFILIGSKPNFNNLLVNFDLCVFEFSFR